MRRKPLHPRRGHRQLRGLVQPHLGSALAGICFAFAAGLRRGSALPKRYLLDSQRNVGLERRNHVLLVV